LFRTACPYLFLCTSFLPSFLLLSNFCLHTYFRFLLPCLPFFLPSCISLFPRCSLINSVYCAVLLFFLTLLRFSCYGLRRMVMLWLCYKFILGDKLAYWRTCLWAFFDWTVSSVQPNGEDRRACSYLALFILVCTQQTDFDRRKSHGTAGNIGNSLDIKLSILGGTRLPVNRVHCWLIAVFQETLTGVYVVSWLMGSDLVSFLAFCLQNWILSLGHSFLPLKKESPYFFETSASTHNTALCGSSKDRSLFVIDCFSCCFTM
jgi:hypothetical protein